MSQFLLRQAARVITGAAGPQVASQVAQRLSGTTTRDEDRRRFLIWLSGPFKQARPQAFEQLWPRLKDSDATTNALTGVFLELQSSGPSATTIWFVQLAESDEQQFAELIAAIQPRQTDPRKVVEQASKEAETSLRGAARFLGRAYRRSEAELEKIQKHQRGKR